MDYKQTIIEREKAKPGFRGKVNAKCVECLFDPQEPGTWRQQVENCTATACPLHSARATSSAEKEDDE